MHSSYSDSMQLFLQIIFFIGNNNFDVILKRILNNVNMTQLQMLRKSRCNGGPIFNVVLEC